jgi:hypothetical protein
MRSCVGAISMEKGEKFCLFEILLRFAYAPAQKWKLKPAKKFIAIKSFSGFIMKQHSSQTLETSVLPIHRNKAVAFNCVERQELRTVGKNGLMYANVMW